MNLYRIHQDFNSGYDAAIIAAKDAGRAQLIHLETGEE